MTGLRSRCGRDAASSAVVGEDYAGAWVGVSIPKNRPFARFFGIETAKSRCIRLVRAVSLHPPKKRCTARVEKGSRTETKRLRKRTKTDKIRDLRPKTALFGVKLFGIVGIVVYLQRKNDNP